MIATVTMSKFKLITCIVHCHIIHKKVTYCSFYGSRIKIYLNQVLWVFISDCKVAINTSVRVLVNTRPGR